MDNSIMIYALSEPIKYRDYAHALVSNVTAINRFLSGNHNEHSTYNCEDVIPARQAAETILQVMCEIHDEICAMEKMIKEKDEYKTWRAEVAYFEKKDARD